MKKSPSPHIQKLDLHRQIEGLRVGKIASISREGEVFVDFPGSQNNEVRARFAGSLDLNKLRETASSGRSVLIVFENNDPNLPIIIDTLHSMLDEIAESHDAALEGEKPEDVLIDGRRITFDAQEEIVLRCGKSSITLTKAGKVLIRGAYLLSRSSGANRIKGGSVQIN
ncbi:MAG: hypothetical protein HXX11_13715 [Desulfuromonadales bacterium]|nr:hypothetical protein [Desulfuromonadales bacterium]